MGVALIFGVFLIVGIIGLLVAVVVAVDKKDSE